MVAPSPYRMFPFGYLYRLSPPILRPFFHVSPVCPDPIMVHCHVFLGQHPGELGWFGTMYPWGWGLGGHIPGAHGW